MVTEDWLVSIRKQNVHQHLNLQITKTFSASVVRRHINDLVIFPKGRNFYNSYFLMYFFILQLKLKGLPAQFFN